MTQTLTIRKANIIDIKDILDLISEFYEEGLKECGLNFTDYSLYKTAENFINNGIVIVVYDNDILIGLIGGMVIPSMFDEKEKIAQEAMWFIKKEYRNKELALDLLNRFEEEAKRFNAKHIIMVSLGNMKNEILDRFYKHNGYKLLENQYIKKVV
uniref:Putative acetyltransferase n=1 Tax=viral metagenome TaxID=1070528 RepID=A0A6M3JVN0_9ZZZZ